MSFVMCSASVELVAQLFGRRLRASVPCERKLGSSLDDLCVSSPCPVLEGLRRPDVSSCA